MRDLKNSKLIWLKGIVFLFMGLAASALLLIESPTLRVGILLAVTIWAFCRAYYFAFYVIEHYVDPNYRFSGLLSFVAYALRRRTGPGAGDA
jgi:hypothetical protein